MSGGRKVKVASAIKATLAELVRDLSDPRIRAAGMVSINHVELNRDLSIANVYVGFISTDSELGADEHLALSDAAVAAMIAAAGHLRGPLGRKLAMRRSPELRFFADHSAEFREHLAKIMSGREKD